MRKLPLKRWNWSIGACCQRDRQRRGTWELQVTNTPGKGSTHNQQPKERNSPGLDRDHDVVGESIRRRYADSPGLIDLAAPHKLMNGLYGFGRQRVPLLNRLLARWAVRTGDRISYSPLPLFWRFYRPYESELSAGYEPAALTPQRGRSHPVPALQLRQLSPGATGGEGRARTSGKDPVRVSPKPMDSGPTEQLPLSERQSQAASVLPRTRDASLLPKASVSKERPVPGSPLQPDPLKPSGKPLPDPGLGTAHSPVEPQITSRDPDPRAEITAAAGSGSTILAATRIAPETAPDRPLLPRGSTVASGLFRRATSWLRRYTAKGFPAIHLLRQATGNARTERSNSPAFSRTQPGAA